MAKKINFAKFDFGDDWAGRRTAGCIGQYLIARISLDALIEETPPADQWIRCGAGTGNADFDLAYPTRSHALAALASQFSGYHLEHYNSCYLGPADYNLLKEFYSDTEIRIKKIDRAFRNTLVQFCTHYSEYDPKYTLELLKGFE